MNGLALAGQWKMSDCSPTSQSIQSCPGKTHIMFVVSTAISVIEVIILGTVVITLCRWDLFDSRTASGSRTPMSPTLQSAYWKVPLVFASLIFTAPPLALAILTTKSSSLMLYSIPTIIAYIFTTPFHIGIIIMWRLSCRTPCLPFNALTTKRCVTVVFSLTVLWIFSTIVGGRFAGHSKLLDGMCVTRHGGEGKCEAQMQLYFVASAISTALEALILGATFVMALLPLLRKDKNETDSSSPTRHMATFKGPTRVRSEGA
ncbi:hypothetical protein BJ165DRAFT_1526850 [Panaeolus papilionaceus]|nr:hypothetical protein BJ165DRAFT_1526850 [Panaeolus papilionaceus]